MDTLHRLSERANMDYRLLQGSDMKLMASIRKLSKTIICIVTIGLILTFFSFSQDDGFDTPDSLVPQERPRPTQPAKPQPTGHIGTDHKRLVVVVPATAPSHDLCKCVMSAMALGYPSPIIVNWGQDFRQFTKWQNGVNLLKITGILHYLDAAQREDTHPHERIQEDDLVLIMDAYDTWFQLPPDVLLNRYYESNEKANARLQAQWPGEEPMPMKQTIIVPTQKRCWPSYEEANEELYCDRLPESPMRPDLYGPNTDKNETDYHTVRPRFINGGVYFGEAGDLRRLFRRGYSNLQAHIDKGHKMFSEQGVTGEVLGQQEIWRQWKRENNVTANDMTSMVDEDYEYHIGLDYEQTISIPTVFEEEDGVILPLNNKTAIKEHSDRLGISPVRLKGVPEDVKKARNPVQGKEWGDLPLYADFFSEAVPVIMHHNAHKDHLKQRRIWWWDQTWYFPYLRQLVGFYLRPGEQVPLGTVQTKRGDITYWPVPANELRRQPRMLKEDATKPLSEVSLETLCRSYKETKGEDKNWYDEVFRDGKGPIQV